MCKRLLFLAEILIVLSLFFSSFAWAEDKIRVAATTTTLASITQAIGGDKVDVYAVASPKQNIHFYAPTPKDVLKVKKAQLLIHSGLDLEAWRGPLLDAAANPLFLGEGKESVDVSQGVSLLEVPSTLSRVEGDIHVFGNPHYWMDPLNGKVMAANIAEGLSRIKPENTEFFRKNLNEFLKRIDQKTAEWTAALAPYQGTPIVVYHRSLPYFASRFGLEIAGELEPKPGIPPTPKHLSELVKVIKTKSVKMIVKESFYENEMPGKLAHETGIGVVELVQAVGEKKEAADYFSLFDYNIRVLTQALKQEKPHE